MNKTNTTWVGTIRTIRIRCRLAFWRITARGTASGWDVYGWVLSELNRTRRPSYSFQTVRELHPVRRVRRTR